MSSLSTSLYGSSTNKGVGGLLSGLDTDELVKQMTSSTRNKINRQYQAKQKLLYRQEAYREISTKLISFNNKYFSYSSGSKTNILSPKFFESYTYKSSSNYVNVTGNADNIKNFEINSIEKVASAANFTSNNKVSSGIITSEDITKYTSSLAGETFSIKLDGNTYNLTLSKDLGKNKISNGQEREVWFNDIVEDLNKQLASIKDKDGNLINANNKVLKYKLDGSAEGEYKIVFDTSKNEDLVERKTAELSAASTDFLNVLKMKVGSEASSTSFMDRKDLTRTAKDEMLDGSITFEYNGVLKKIDLSQMRTKKIDGTYVDNYSYDADGLSKFINDELRTAFGDGKITVGAVDKNGNGKSELSFTVDGETNIFGISSISKELSNFTGLESGDYNRVNKKVAIEDSGLKTALSESTSGGYEVEVNGKTVKIEKGTSLNDIITKINNETDVNIYHSATTDTFSVKSKETGAHRDVVVKDVNGGNLAEALFGKSVNSELEEGQYLNAESEVGNIITYKVYDKDNNIVSNTEVTLNKNTKTYTINKNGIISTADYLINEGTDTIMTYTLNGVQSQIARSTSNFTIDEINIELNEKARGLTTTDTPITFDVTNNSDEVVERVKQFIDDYNEIINLIGTKTSEKPKRDYAPLSPEQQEEMEEDEIKSWTEEAKKGILFGDRNMTNVLRSMRETMSGLTDVSSITLSSIGISSASMDTSGKLVFDEAKFKEKLLDNPDEIARLFTASTSSTDKDAREGIAIQLQSMLRANVGTYGTTGILIDEAGLSGSMTSDKNYISEKIEEYDDKMAELKKDLETERQRYWNQFSSLESSLNKLNMQSSWLTDMMGQ